MNEKAVKCVLNASSHFTSLPQSMVSAKGRAPGCECQSSLPVPVDNRGNSSCDCEQEAILSGLKIPSFFIKTCFY